MKSVAELAVIGVSHPLQTRDRWPRALSGRHLPAWHPAARIHRCKTSGWKAITTDFGLAIGFLLAANVSFAIFGHLMRAAPNCSIRNLLPRTGLERIAFLLLAAAAGFCEEVIYRRYLQRQFALRFDSVAAGVVSQSLVFGASRIYQGPRMAAAVCLYGCLYGLLALWRKHLRPAMIAHFLQDAVGGMLLARYALR